MVLNVSAPHYGAFAAKPTQECLGHFIRGSARGAEEGRDVDRGEGVSSICADPKRFVTERRAAIITCAQLNRQLEQRPSKIPMLSDLRESGSIEQDSSLVMFLYREFVYNTQADPSHAELILTKQRNGPSGVKIPLTWDGKCAKFLTSDRVLGEGSASSTGQCTRRQRSALLRSPTRTCAEVGD